MDGASSRWLPAASIRASGVKNCSTNTSGKSLFRKRYQVPGVAETVNLHHIKQHYYASHRSVNPTGIVPRGPEIDFSTPHGRA